MGLWSALIIGYGVTTAIAVVAVYRSDWDALVEEALVRSECTQVSLPTILETASEHETDGYSTAEPSPMHWGLLRGGASSDQQPLLQPRGSEGYGTVAVPASEHNSAC